MSGGIGWYVDAPWTAGFNPRRPDFAEHVIHSLQAPCRERMARLVMAGYRFHVSDCTAVGNRWWNALDPQGHHLGAMGGRDLRDVIDRVWARDGQII